jgi:hypothetical protein
MNIFCVTNTELNYLTKLPVKLAGVGNKKFSNKYTTCLKGKNIQQKEKNYSELTFHYWFWKNKLKKYKNKNIWIGFCQKRRFWVKKKNKNFIISNLLNSPLKEWNNHNSVICEKIFTNNIRFMKMIKRGWKNIIKDPRILFQKKRHTIKLHFDMFHGYGNIDLAINVMHKKDKQDFSLKGLILQQIYIFIF